MWGWFEGAASTISSLVSSNVEDETSNVKLPWERDDVPEQRKAELESTIRNLSKLRRTYMEPAPSSFVYEFDVNLAKKMLQVDQDLSRFRWDLVPGKIREEGFWRNYFYRVDLAYQSVKEIKVPKKPETKEASVVEKEENPNVVKRDIYEKEKEFDLQNRRVAILEQQDEEEGFVDFVAK